MDELVTHSSRGAVFETFVLTELLKAYLNQGLEPDVHFWRDSAGNEVDLVLDHGMELVPIEIKSGETVAADFFKGLQYWRSLTGQKDYPATLVFGGRNLGGTAGSNGLLLASLAVVAHWSHAKMFKLCATTSDEHMHHGVPCDAKLIETKWLALRQLFGMPRLRQILDFGIISQRSQVRPPPLPST